MITLASLLSAETYTTLLAKGLEAAESVGLPVSSWRDGDPTKSQYQYLATILETLENAALETIASGFLKFATGDALTQVASDLYDVERTEDSTAAGDLVLENTGAGVYTIDPGDLRFRASTINKTYVNTTGGSLAAFGTLTLSFEAEESGADSSVAANEIDELVTTLQGVEIQSSDPAYATDQETDEALRERCRASLGALSLAGPADAYNYVATTPALTGVTSVTKARTFADSDDGTVLVVLGGPSGGVDGASVTAVTDAVLRWATPLTITPTVQSATPVQFDLAITCYLFTNLGAVSADVIAAAEAAVEALIAELPIGGHNGRLNPALVISRVQQATAAYNVTLTGSEVDANWLIADTEIAQLSSVSVNVVFTEYFA